MIMICVQYKADSFASSDADDGVILDVGGRVVAARETKRAGVE